MLTRLMILILFIATAGGSILDKLPVGGGDLVAIFVGLLLLKHLLLILAARGTFFLNLDIRGFLWSVFLQPLSARADMRLVLVSLQRSLIAR